MNSTKRFEPANIRKMNRKPVMGGIRMKTFFALCLGITLGLLAIHVQAGGSKVAMKVVEETIEAAAKRSGRVLSKTAESRLGRELLEATAKYGDDVMPIVRKGGLEVLEQGAKHGDDFWRLCKTVPAGSRALALHADDLMPLARRIGPEVLQIEARTPGMAVRIAGEFGDDAVKLLAKNPQDTTRLLGYAAKADSPETAKLLYQTYAKSPNPSAFLERLNWKQIMAGGLSAAAIVAAGGSAVALYQVGDGLQEGLNNPETAEHFVETFSKPVGHGLYVLVAILLFPLGILSFRLSRKAWNLTGKNGKTTGKNVAAH